MPARRRLQRLIAILALVMPAIAAAAGAEPLRVAVAANFRSTAEALRGLYRDEGYGELTLSSASTGVLAAQLRSGAPFDVLLAADRERPQTLFREGFGLDSPSCYAQGSLVLLGAERIDSALADSQQSIAIANPVSAPYGAAAVEVLGRPGFADAQARRVLRGSNVLQAYQYFESGAADLALVARSLSPAQGLPIPPQWHAPIEQFALISRRSQQPELARAFLRILGSAEAAPILTANGYAPCS